MRVLCESLLCDESIVWKLVVWWEYCVKVFCVMRVLCESVFCGESIVWKLVVWGAWMVSCLLREGHVVREKYKNRCSSLWCIVIYRLLMKCQNASGGKGAWFPTCRVRLVDLVHKCWSSSFVKQYSAAKEASDINYVEQSNSLVINKKATSEKRRLKRNGLSLPWHFWHFCFVTVTL